MENMKEMIRSYLMELGTYDYIYFASVLVTFIILIFLASILYRKIYFSLFLLFTAVVILIFSPNVGHKLFNDYLYKVDVNISEVKDLEYSSALLIRGTIINVSDFKLGKCTVSAHVFKVGHNQFLDTLYPLNPFKKKKMVLEDDIDINSTLDYKFLIEPFDYEKDYNVSIKASCKSILPPKLF